jgi:hypothetical protein
MRVDIACNGGKVARYEKGAMPSSYTPTTTSFGAYGQTLNISRAAAFARRKSTTTVSAEDTGDNGDNGDSAPSKPLPWWIWPTAAAVLLGGVGYYGTKKGWL